MITTRLVKKTLACLKITDLRQLAQENGLRVHSNMTKNQIIQDLLWPQQLSLKFYGGARTGSPEADQPVTESPEIKSDALEWDKIPEPALINIIKRLSRQDFDSFRNTSKKFNDRIKKLETRSFYKKMIAGLNFVINTPHTSALAWSPDGSRLACCGGWGACVKSIQIWKFNQETGAQVKEPLELNIRGARSTAFCLAWSPDVNGNGSRLASGGSGHLIQIWKFNQDTGAQDGAPLEFVSERNRYVYSLAWSPDGDGNGSRLASIGGDGIIRIWKFIPDTGNLNGAPLELSDHTNNVTRLAWSPDENGNGSRLASGGMDGIVRIWFFDQETGDLDGEPLELLGHTDSVHSLAWSPDGNGNGSILASGGKDGSILIWRFSTDTGDPVGEPLILDQLDPLDYRSWVLSLAWSPDENGIGSRLASGRANDTIRIWYPDLLFD